MEKFIAYYRVSTKKQGVSGLGLEAQQTSVNNYIKTKGYSLLKEFTEVETGTGRKKRMVVYQALETCKQNGANLIIAKIDRLTRDSFFWEQVKQSGVRCISLDNPDGNEMFADLLVVFAVAEGKRIRERIKEATRVKIKRGDIIGNPDKLHIHRLEAIANSVKTRQELARIKNFQATGMICDYRNSGWAYQKIANRLNELNFKTSREKSWTSKGVELLYKRYCLA